jgi:nitrite reductase/ring-hydroxylating ferredoxin subunit/uncharacterized membrane protein
MLAVLKQTVTAIGRAQRLDNLAMPLQAGISAAFARGGGFGRRLQNGLNGVWLGHPLHPVLTDVPIGFWTAAVSLDAVDAFTGREDLTAAADIALGLGIGAAAGTALTGLADWQFTVDERRRIGLVHATLNIGATLLNVLSLILRRQRRRTAGRCLALAGYLVISVSAYLGGDLIYKDRIGVDHAAGQTPPEDFVPVLADADLLEGQPRRAGAQGMPVVLVRQGGQIYALVETCAHLGGPLSEGRLEDGAIVCPWHGSRFALADGHTLDGPSVFPQPILETRVRDGQIEVRAMAGE